MVSKVIGDRSESVEDAAEITGKHGSLQPLVCQTVAAYYSHTLRVEDGDGANMRRELFGEL